MDHMTLNRVLGQYVWLDGLFRFLFCARINVSIWKVFDESLEVNGIVSKGCKFAKSVARKKYHLIIVLQDLPLMTVYLMSQCVLYVLDMFYCRELTNGLVDFHFFIGMPAQYKRHVSVLQLTNKSLPSETTHLFTANFSCNCNHKSERNCKPEIASANTNPNPNETANQCKPIPVCALYQNLPMLYYILSPSVCFIQELGFPSRPNKSFYTMNMLCLLICI